MRKEIEEAASNLINQYLNMFYKIYNDKNIPKIDRLRMMRKLKRDIVVSLESMEDYVVENK
jgi:hypothetical protein